MLAKGSLPSGQWSGTSPFSGFAVCQKNSNVRCSMSSSDGAAAPVIAAAAAAGGTAPVVAGAGSPVDAAGAGAWTATVFATGAEAGASLADALTDAAVAGAAVVVLAAGGAVGAAEVAYRECSTGTIPASSSTHSSAMPARRSVREPADHPGFFDECGAPRFMAHDQRRGTRTGSARQCLRASSGGPGIRPPLRPCSASHARVTLDAFATLQTRPFGEASFVADTSALVYSVPGTPYSPVRMQHTHARSAPECTRCRCRPDANFVARRWQRCESRLGSEFQAHRHLERARIAADVAGRVVDDRNPVHPAVGTPRLQVTDVDVPVEGVDQVDAHIRAERAVEREVLGGLQVDVAVAENLAADQEAAVAGRKDADRLVAAPIERAMIDVRRRRAVAGQVDVGIGRRQRQLGAHHKAPRSIERTGHHQTMPRHFRRRHERIVPDRLEVERVLVGRIEVVVV